MSPFLQIEPVTSRPKLSRRMEQLSTIPLRILAVFKGLQLEPRKCFGGWGFFPKSSKPSYFGLSLQLKNWILTFSSSKNFKLVEIVVLHLNLQCSCTCILDLFCLLWTGITLLTHFHLWATAVPDNFKYNSSYPVIPVLYLGICFLL